MHRQLFSIYFGSFYLFKLKHISSSDLCGVQFRISSQESKVPCTMELLAQNKPIQTGLEQAWCLLFLQFVFCFCFSLDNVLLFYQFLILMAMSRIIFKKYLGNRPLFVREEILRTKKVIIFVDQFSRKLLKGCFFIYIAT